MPKYKSLFNVSFLLIILLTTALLLVESMLRGHWIMASLSTNSAILLGAVFFLLLNHLVFLNNSRFKKLDDRMVHLSRHNTNTCSILLLVNVIIICGFMLIIAE